MSLVCDENRNLTFQKISLKERFVFNPRKICGYCNTPYSIIIRYSARLNDPGGKRIEAFNLLKVELPELLAEIKGQQEASRGVSGEVILNASQSHDPDSLAYGVLSFNWFCSYKMDNTSLNESCGNGKMTSNGSILVVYVNRLKSMQSYYFKVLISKGNRKKESTHVLKVHPAVNFTFR